MYSSEVVHAVLDFPKREAFMTIKSTGNLDFAQKHFSYMLGQLSDVFEISHLTVQHIRISHAYSWEYLYLIEKGAYKILFWIWINV